MALKLHFTQVEHHTIEPDEICFTVKPFTTVTKQAENIRNKFKVTVVIS